MIKKSMNRKKNGFTMAEMMIVVAIIMILAGFAFVNVIRYQRSLRQLERDGIAKEIFVAAQNHLSMADSQGLLSNKEDSFYGNKVAGASDVYYFVANGTDAAYPDDSDNALTLMLPYASIDETIRTGGSYIIRYQYNESVSRILDVFYSTDNGGFGYVLRDADYDNLIANIDDREYRRNYNGGVIGYYGGEDALDLKSPYELDSSLIKVVNGDTLYVVIDNTSNSVKTGDFINLKDDAVSMNLKLVITGKTSGKKATIELIKNGVLQNDILMPDSNLQEMSFMLDDITVANKHFKEQFPDFVAGEDITLEVIADNTSALSNITSSGKIETNSLYMSLDKSNNNDVANIATIRHLENLGSNISNHQIFDDEAEINAVQVANIDWNTFKNNMTVDSNFGIYEYNSNNRNSTFVPVIDNKPVIYSAKNNDDAYRINNVEIASSNSAVSTGIFSELKAMSRISDVMFVNCVVSGGTNTGTVAGLATTTEFVNVIVYGNRGNVYGGANSGGIVGSMSGGSIHDSSASVYVSASNNAGGLVGTASGITISESYSGGHTANGKYSTATYNVNGTNNAGGLIGYAESSRIENSYSTCSVRGRNAGGLAGTATNMNEIRHNYATGLVSYTSNGGALFGIYTGAISFNNYYFESINRELSACGSGNVNAIAADANTVSYRNIVSATSIGRTVPYDVTLNYPYPFLSTRGLYNGENGSGRHYGDWPDIESYAVNRN